MFSIRNRCSMCPCRELESGAEVALLDCIEGCLVKHHNTEMCLRQPRGQLVFEGG